MVFYNKEHGMFYLSTHSTHFIYRHMVKGHLAREETGSIHYIGKSFRLAAWVFYMHHTTGRIIHITAFVTPDVEHWMETEIYQ